MNRSLVLAVTLIGLGISAFACGGKVMTDDSGSLSSKQKGGPADVGDDDDDAPASGVTKKPTTSEPVPSGSTTRTCTFGGGSASGSTDGAQSSCETTSFYNCSDGEAVTFTCRCGAGAVGSCTCGSQTFEFDCSRRCVGPKPADYKRCNLPSLDDGTSGTSGSSTSSSG